MFYEDFTVTPRIFQVGRETVFSGRMKYVPRNIKMGHAVAFKLKYITGNGVWEDGKTHVWEDEREYPCTFNSDGTFSFRFTAAEEGETTFKVILALPAQNREVVLGKFGCYALEDDLFNLKPFKGDTHVHTSWSECGRIEEEPARVAAVGRRKGLDFVFITDHAKQYPSREAIAAFEAFNSDYRVFPGEETHLLKQHSKDGYIFENSHVWQSIHLLSLGAKESVVAYADDHYEEFTAEIAKRMEAFDPAIPEEVRLLMAGADWILEKTREFGGVAVFAHPFWQPCDRINLPPEVREYIFEKGLFDAVEVLGLGSTDNEPAAFAGNVDCISWLHEKSLELGRKIPVTGATDSHRAPVLLGTQYTITFVKENTLAGVQEAIRNGKTVACRARDAEHPFFWGDFRLVRYAGFLYREFFPEHDEYCAVEGQLMQQSLRGEVDRSLVNAYSKDRFEELYRRYWGC